MLEKSGERNYETKRDCIRHSEKRPRNTSGRNFFRRSDLPAPRPIFYFLDFSAGPVPPWVWWAEDRNTKCNSAKPETNNRLGRRYPTTSTNAPNLDPL